MGLIARIRGRLCRRTYDQGLDDGVFLGKIFAAIPQADKDAMVAEAMLRRGNTR